MQMIRADIKHHTKHGCAYTTYSVLYSHDDDIFNTDKEFQKLLNRIDITLTIHHTTDPKPFEIYTEENKDKIKSMICGLLDDWVGI
jgi:hypothetical protein